MVLESRVRLLMGQSLSSTASPRRVSLSGSRAAEIKVNGISCPSCCCGGGSGGRTTTAAIAPDPRPLIHNIRDVAKPPAKQKKKKVPRPSICLKLLFFFVMHWVGKRVIV